MFISYIKIKLKIYFFLLFLTSVQAQNSKKIALFELEGLVTNSDKKNYIYLGYINNKNNFVIDSTKIINNHFEIKGEIDFPTQVYISNSRQFVLDNINTQTIYLEPRKMKITFDFYDLKTIQLQESETQNEYKSLEEIKVIFYTRRDSIRKLIKSNHEKLQTATDTLKKNEYEKRRNELYEKLNKNEKDGVKIDLNFVKQNPSSYIAPYVLIYRFKREDATYDTINLLYNCLAKKIKESSKGIDLKVALLNSKSSRVGCIAPNFSANDIKDEKIILSSYRFNNYILIDFWASWCAPCREDLSLLKSLYNKYSEKGFEIISISIDNNLKLWKKAIEKEEIQKWIHISILENKNSIDLTYDVSSIPVKILIDKEGKIIGRWSGSGIENEKELKKLLEENIKE